MHAELPARHCCIDAVPAKMRLSTNLRVHGFHDQATSAGRHQSKNFRPQNAWVLYMSQKRALSVRARLPVQMIMQPTCHCNTGCFSLLVIPRGQLDILAASTGGLEQRVQVVRGVGPVCEASRPQDGEGQATLLQQLL